MKKQLMIIGSLFMMAGLLNAQTTWNGTSTTGSADRTGKVGIGMSNPLYQLDVSTSVGGQGIRVTQTGYGSAALHLNNTGSNGQGTGKQWSLYSSGAGDVGLGDIGNFAIMGSPFSSPNFFISGTTGNVGLFGAVSPSAAVQIGGGTGNLHYGSTGILVKFPGDITDRALMELHSPDGANRVDIQSLSSAAYFGSLDNKPLLLQTSPTGFGNVGIGVPGPSLSGRLHIATDNSPMTGLYLDHNYTGQWSYGLLVNVKNQDSKALAVNKTENNATEEIFLVYGDGRVRIGTGSPKIGSYVQNAKLSVDGMVFAREFFVAISSTYWADYVFNKDYKLMPISSVKNYIEKEKHLPGVPAAIDLEKKGLSLSDMQKAQMEKIEELYLYVIQLKEEVDALRKENETLRTNKNQ